MHIPHQKNYFMNYFTINSTVKYFIQYEISSFYIWIFKINLFLKSSYLYSKFYTDEILLTTFTAMFGRFCISAVFIVVILHTAELFPTEVRNSSIGTSSTMAHIGSISAPYVVDFLVSFIFYSIIFFLW